MINNNFKYLLSISNKKLNVAAKEIGISQNAIWYWRKGKKPSPNTLRRIARYFSDTLSIPYDFFEDGKALLEKDFENLFKKDGFEVQNLHSSDKSIGVMHENLKVKVENIPIREISEQEKDFLLSLRQLFNRRPDLETSETDLKETLDLAKSVHPGSDLHHSLARTMKSLRQYHEDMGHVNPKTEKDSEVDKK